MAKVDDAILNSAEFAGLVTLSVKEGENLKGGDLTGFLPTGKWAFMGVEKDPRTFGGREYRVLVFRGVDAPGTGSNNGVIAKLSGRALYRSCKKDGLDETIESSCECFDVTSRGDIYNVVITEGVGPQFDAKGAFRTWAGQGLMYKHDGGSWAGRRAYAHTMTLA